MVQSNLTWEELSELVGSDYATLSAKGDLLGDEVVRCEVLQAGAQYRQLLCLRLFDAGQGWRDWPSCAAWLTAKVGWHYKTANERLRVARSLARLPKIDAAFRNGQLSYTKVRALHDVATPDNEELLLDQARHATGEQLRRLMAPLRADVNRARDQESLERRRSVRFLRPEPGLFEVRATLLSEEGGTLRKALDVGFELLVKERRRRRKDESAAADHVTPRVTYADALVLMSERFLADPPLGGVPLGRRELLIHTVPDLSVGVLEDGTPLSPETLRRLACDGPTVKVLRTPEGDVLDVGRRTRRVSKRMERALLVRDRYCRFPSCTRRIMLDAHHVEHWEDGGHTKLGNLILLCRRHHRHVHEGGWRTRRRADGALVFVDRWGKEVEPPEGRAEIDADSSHAVLLAECRRRGLDPDPGQLVALSGGESYDLGWASTVIMHNAGYTPGPNGEASPAVRWILDHFDDGSESSERGEL